jgi:hypothetical protein
MSPRKRAILSAHLVHTAILLVRCSSFIAILYLDVDESTIKWILEYDDVNFSGQGNRIHGFSELFRRVVWWLDTRLVMTS